MTMKQSSETQARDQNGKSLLTKAAGLAGSASGGSKLALLIYHLIDPIIDIRRLLALPKYCSYWMEWLRYSRMPGAETTSLLEAFPCVQDRLAKHQFDRHYFYQDIWAYRRIYESAVTEHVDVGSRVDFVGMLTAITSVTFVDIRPLEANLERLQSRKGSILDLPFEDESVASLSCLHVAEHIGLGRYGDELDPKGTIKAARELTRVLGKGGNLYFSMPIGRTRVCFNGMRVHSPRQVLEYFDGLRLVQFAAIDDQRSFHTVAEPSDYEDSVYACGLFWFRKPE